METGEDCAGVEGRGCLAARPAPAPRCGLEVDSDAETGLIGAVEGSGCGCARPDVGPGHLGGGWLGLFGVLLIVLWTRR